jgi:hypothetical protein
MSLAGRTHMVSEQFDAALQRAGVKVRRVDHVLARPAAGLKPHRRRLLARPKTRVRPRGMALLALATVAEV